MIDSESRWLLPAFALVLSACGSGPREVASAPPAVSPAPAQIEATPVPPTAAQAGATQGARPLTLEDALRAALENNPDLATVRQGEKVSEAALAAARTYPYNPKLSVDVRPFTLDRNGDTEQVLVSTALLQEFELAGQGGHRRRAGEAEVDIARLRTLEEELRVMASTARSFFTAAYRRQARELDESLARLQEDVLGIVQRRFQAGLAGIADVTLARLESQTARQAAQLSRARAESALLDLRKALAPGIEGPVEPSIDLETLVGRGRIEVPGGPEAVASSRPDVRAAEAEVRAADARADLASASRVPNVTAGPVFEKDETGTLFLGIEAEVPIPILDTGGPAARERQANAERTREALRQARIKARADASAAMSRYEDAWRAASQSSSIMAGDLEAQVASIRDQYAAGQTDIVKVYLAQANLLKARTNHLEALYELALAAVDLGASAALPPDVLYNSSAPSK